ncbi:MAG: 16S rRNA (cytosine(1402)-N(4))-methyltransferase RsmH [Candidatus Doudnabacteria bacterium]|nr:16S rRNA (cytosine(1402)-N(4))-methyltransferase RsmH [Candidatus Doudnabacteria bacterium]
MQIEKYQHVPVLLKEVVAYLDPKPGQNFVDATLGGGSYTEALLERNQPAGQILAIDLDQDAIENFRIGNTKYQIPNTILHHGNFRDIDKIVKGHDFPAPDGIVADIGLSSYQLDQSGRGISFQKKEILDMRFDKSSEEPDAKFILNNYEPAWLLKIFREFGEEKYSREIVKKILELRAKGQEIKYTSDLYSLIQDALPKPVKHRADDSARRAFQALRIEVNHELDNLQAFLPKAFDLLKIGGRLAVISFHSLEDRLVKQFLIGLAKGCVCPPEFPRCICGHEPQGKILSKKPITASAEEVKQNPRSRPAKLRLIEKI